MSENQPRKKRWPWLVGGLLLFVLLIGGPVGFFWYRNHQLSTELQEVIAELDKNDPNWRLEEIAAARPPLADKDNAALEVLAIYGMMPREWGTVLLQAGYDFDPLQLPAPIEMNASQTEMVRQELESAKAALLRARKLRLFPKGRYKVQWKENRIWPSLEGLDKTSEVCHLLQTDIVLLCQEKKTEQAWESCQSLYRVSTSIGNPDSLMSLLTRIGRRAQAIESMQRVLAAGEISDGSLAQTQKLLHDDLQESVLWMALRGERAGLHKALVALENGTISLEQIDPELKKRPWYGKTFNTAASGKFRNSHIWTLKYMTGAVDAAHPSTGKKNKPSEQVSVLAGLSHTVASSPLIASPPQSSIPYPASLLVTDISNVAQADIRSRMQLQCTIVALACERYRLRFKHWPNSLQELVDRKYIAEVPHDPRDKKPLRYKQTKNGVVILGAGNGVYSGYKGELLDDPEYHGTPRPHGFHLWNVDKRRQQPVKVITDVEGLMYSDVWTAGKDGYHTYRIPALVRTEAGTLLAFCEGRKDNARDHGNIDLLIKRSTDNGKTWSKHKIVYEEGGDKKITIGNPCPVVDQKTGIIWLPMTRDNNDVLITHSKDDGLTWAKPVKITDAVKKKNWGWYATGPGVGIQMETGKYQGRLVIPCDHREGKPGEDKGPTFSHVFYSDDHGKTWKLGGTVAKHTNECQVVELPDGKLLINMRNYWGRDGKDKTKGGMRAVALSKDGGQTWGKLAFDKTLIEPVCQASLVGWRFFGHGLLLFSNPASKRSRVNLTVRLSKDSGKTWPRAKIIHRGSAAYSCLAALPSGNIGCLYEGGNKSAYEKIRFARFSLNWLAGN